MSENVPELARGARARGFLLVGVLATAAACRGGSERANEGSRRDAGKTPSAVSVRPSASTDVVSSASPGPDTVSHASPASSGPPVVTAGRVDGAALRRAHIERLKTDRSPVTILQGSSALELGRRICEAVVPRRPATQPVLVKPNICGFDGIKDPPKNGDDGVSGRVTDPEFVRGVVRCLRDRGYQRITIAEGCGGSNKHWKNTIRVSGFEAMASEEKVPLVAMDDDGVYDVEGDQPGKPMAIDGIAGTHVPTLLMPKLLAETLERGLFISVPKLKVHRYAVVSIGIKGMQGTVMRSEASPAYNQKWRMHAELKDYLKARKNNEPEDRSAYVASLELFAERMLDVLEISMPDVILADGAPAVAGDGFQYVSPLPGKVAIGGTNPVLVDRVGSEYLGLWNNALLAKELGGHRSSPLIELAQRRYGLELGAPALAGDGVGRLKETRPVFFRSMAPFTLEGGRVTSRAPAGAPPSDAGPPDAGSNPTAHAVRADGEPAIDGRAEAVWSKAPKATFDTDYAGTHTNIATSVRFLWTPSALFALFELAGAGVNSDASRPIGVERTKLYEEDCVELFLAPDAARRTHYYEIELGPLGHFFDLEIDRDKKSSNTAWSSGLSVKTTRDVAARSVTIEARFSAPELVRALAPGARLPLGVFRMEGSSPRNYLAFSPPRTTKPNFHVPEAFGTLAVE